MQRYSSTFSALVSTPYANVVNSDAGYTYDASYVRLRNVSLSFQLPSAWQQKMHLANARIFVQGQNLLTITKYIGLDPESGSTVIPPLRTITVGGQLVF
jgi:hypothetical protein